MTGPYRTPGEREPDPETGPSNPVEAKGGVLDRFGTIFGLGRLVGENDDDYRVRLVLTLRKL